MSVSKIITGNVYRQNGGSVIMGGDVSRSNAGMQNLGRTTYSFQPVQNTSILPPNSATSNINTTNVSRTYGKVTKERYIVYMYTHYLGGVSFTAFNKAADDVGRKSIHHRANKRTRKVVTAGWNYTTGQPLSSPTASNDSFGASDKEATASRSVPGALVLYKFGAPRTGTLSIPDTPNYPARTL